MPETDKTQLQQLWQRRNQLDETEWEQLRIEVFRTIKRQKQRISELHSLSFPLEDYIEDFFVEKILRPALQENFKENELFSDNALITYFRNYLRDLLKDPMQQSLSHALSIEKELEPGNNEEGTPSPNIGDSLEASPNQDDVTLLREVKLTLEQVKKSAQQFLRENENWVCLYLACHVCLDKETSTSLSQLAKNHQVPNYHRRARQLGITRKKEEFERGKDEFQQEYEKTLLGAWLLSLGLSTQKENFAEMDVALKILCSEALLLIGDDAEIQNPKSKIRNPKS